MYTIFLSKLGSSSLDLGKKLYTLKNGSKTEAKWKKNESKTEALHNPLLTRCIPKKNGMLEESVLYYGRCLNNYGT